MLIKPQRLFAIFISAACLAAAHSAALGQTEPTAVPIEVVDIKPQSHAGLWPTSRMLDSLVRRLAAEVGEKYDLRPEQRRAVEERMVGRWGSFFERNRRELEPLLTDYLETRLALEPPSADHVADWAARAMPVFRRLKRAADAGEQEVRDMLDANQRVDFDRGRLERQMGLSLFEGQLRRWSVGKYRQDEWWDPPAGHEARVGRQAPAPPDRPDAAAQHVRATQPVDQVRPARITEELHAWEKYVADFCDQLALDRSQRNAADSIVREMITRATDHVQLHRERIAALEAQIAGGTGGGSDAFERALQATYGPIDAMFRELVERVDKLPTTGQRRRAEIEQQAPLPDDAPLANP